MGKLLHVIFFSPTYSVICYVKFHIFVEKIPISHGDHALFGGQTSGLQNFMISYKWQSLGEIKISRRNNYPKLRLFLVDVDPVGQGGSRTQRINLQRNALGGDARSILLQRSGGN